MAPANSSKKSRMNVRCNVGILTLGLMMLGAAAAQATATFTLSLSDPGQTATLPNQTLVTFAGTIANTGNEALYLNGRAVAFLPGAPTWAVDGIVNYSVLDSVFWPDPLNPGADVPLAVSSQYTGTLFTLYVGVTLDTPTMDSLAGTFTVDMQGGTSFETASQEAQFTLDVIPEPASLALLGLGLLGLIRRPRKVRR